METSRALIVALLLALGYCVEVARGERAADCGGDCGSTMRDESSEAAPEGQVYSVSCPEDGCSQEVFLRLSCSDSDETTEITRVDLEVQLQRLDNRVSALLNESSSSHTAISSLEDKMAALEERLESLLELVSSFP